MKATGRQGKMSIHEFELKKIQKNSAIVIIAKRGSGKSWVCRDIINHFRSIPVGIIISKTERVDPFYSKFFPDTYIYDEYKASIMEKLLARQEAMNEKKKKYKKLGKKIDTRALIIMDDCLSDKKNWINEQGIKEILFNGRHHDITYVLTMQYPLGITPDLRDNFDYVFLLADDNHINQEKIFKHYAGVFPKFGAFQEVYNQLTSNFGCMVISNRGARATFFDKVFWYKARDIIPPVIGNEQFRIFHDKNYDENWKKKKKGDTIDILERLSKRKEPIKVAKVRD